ncbi:hypothetical protein [Streptomyces syringium]|uniref:hypothetical protein n=1 Tax=Streptomyces syringium TaxID=76729 RepID=UPI0033D98685
MIFRLRRKLLAGVAGIVVVGTVGTAVNAAAAPGPADGATQSYAVETFDYPNAAKILKERGIALRKGDGHILLADCAATHDIVVSTTALDNVDRGRYCFKVTGTGKTGYLTLEIPKVVTIGTGDYNVQAKLTADSETTTVDVPKNDMTSVGQGTQKGGGPAVLVELRVTG